MPVGKEKVWFLQQWSKSPCSYWQGPMYSFVYQTAFVDYINDTLHTNTYVYMDGDGFSDTKIYFIIKGNSWSLYFLSISILLGV